MSEQLIECVPNFSEGRDMSVIQRITDAIESVDGVTLLDVDPGAATNRTVVTFVGRPGSVVEAAVKAGAMAAELIDMRQHQGEHPRFGAMDVCPLVPVANISMEETVEHAHLLARALGEEVGLTIYCYEHAARTDQRRNLAVVREGEYEGLQDKLKDAAWKPDYGPGTFNAQSGATAVGARDFLIAYNVNLNTTSTRRANAIAFDVREKGRVKREGNPLTGPIAKDAAGDEVWIPGMLPCTKGIGWFIDEYGVAQISLNLTNISITPMHAAFDACDERARARGIRVTGSELVGLVPLEAMLDAGRHYLYRQQRSIGVSDAELIKIAVRSMGLDELSPFKPEEKIIEYAIAAKRGDSDNKLVKQTLEAFTHETASESPAPGGGSIAASVGAFGAALATMVANLSSHKRGWDERWEAFSEWAERGKQYHDELLHLIDADTDAFNRIMDAFRLPQGTAQEQELRNAEIERATKGAIEIPLRVMEVASESFDVIDAMADEGLEASISDAGVAALCARTAVRGAELNVVINAKDVKDREWADAVLARAAEMVSRADQLEAAILEKVRAKL